MAPCDTTLDNGDRDCRTLTDDHKAAYICVLPRIHRHEGGVPSRSVGAFDAVAGAHLLFVLPSSSVLRTHVDRN